MMEELVGSQSEQSAGALLLRFGTFFFALVAADFLDAAE